MSRVSSAGISDVMDVLVESSTHISNETYVYEDIKRVMKHILNLL